MAFKTRSASAKKSTRPKRVVVARRIEDPEIEIAPAEEVVAPPALSPRSSPQENGGNRENRLGASQPRGPTPVEEYTPNGEWFLRAMQNIGIPLQELLNQACNAGINDRQCL